MTRFRLAAAALAAALAAAPAHAQVSGTNLLEPRLGTFVHQQPKDRLDLYDRLDLVFARDGLAAGLRWEVNRTSDDDPLGGRPAQYEAITQRWAEWSDGRLRLRVGHAQTILGRGLIHRSFELPGVTYDEPGTRTRYAAARDVDGVLAEAALGPLALRAFGGRPNDATVSPASAAQGAPRHAGVLAGGQAELSLPRSTRAGAAFARYTFGTAPAREFGSGWLGADLLAALGVRAAALPVYFEYAQRGGTLGDWWGFRRGEEAPHALYASATALRGGWALAAEYKDYDGFRSGLNDPPQLVREHALSLLNRNTHLLDADGEEGFQLELSGPLHAWVTLTANLSRADGPPNRLRLVRFEERFGELRVAPPGSEAWEVRAFAGRGFDTADFVSDRHAGGASGTLRLPGGFAAELGVERQRAVRTGFTGTAEPFDDVLVNVAVSRAGWGTAGLTTTRTTDPLDRPADAFGNPTAPSATFAGLTLAGAIAPRTDAALFAGRRRGGRACVSGACFDVPSLDGAELRITSRF